MITKLKYDIYTKKEFRNRGSWKVELILLFLGIVMLMTLVVPALAQGSATPAPVPGSPCLLGVGDCGFIAGMVTDTNSGAAIPGATVNVGGSTTTTDATGSYNISITPGTYTATASANGYGSSSASVTAILGKTVILNFALNLASAPTGKITGTITDANSGAAIAGATVTVGSVTATTDYSGSYIIEIAAGTYTVTASANGYNAGSTSVVVSPGTTVSGSLALKPISTPTGKITGTITDANSGAAIAGATVTVGSITATTDYSGSYIIEIAANTYTVTASAPGYNTGSTSVVVSPGTTTSGNLALKPISAETPPPAPTLGVPSQTSTPVQPSQPGFDIPEVIVVLAILIIGTMRKQKKR